MATAASVAEIFGLPANTKDAAGLIKNFDFSKTTSSSQKSDEHFNFGLAPAFGSLNKESIKKMDDSLKTMIAATLRDLKTLKNKSWENVQSMLLQNPFLEPMGDGTTREDSFSKSGTSAFKFDGSPNAGIVREVEAWFNRLIDDADVRKSTNIDINVLAKIVAASGAAVDSFEAFFFKSEHHSQKVLEIGVLRFPDLDNPFFKVYRIALTAWSDSRRVIFVEENTNGIHGEFSVRRYKPRESVISRLREDIKKVAVKEAERYFL